MVDVVRASGLFDEAPGMQKMLEEAIKHLEMVRAKDRLNNPLPTGYRDLLLNVRFRDHVCELQLHVKAIHAHKELAHEHYDYQRVIDAGQEPAPASSQPSASPPASEAVEVKIAPSFAPSILSSGSLNPFSASPANARRPAPPPPLKGRSLSMITVSSKTSEQTLALVV